MHAPPQVVIDLLFAILAGNAYTALYEQQEDIYFALYSEVTLAKSLLEQLTLVGQSRLWYASSLRCIERYLVSDLRRLDVTPVVQLSKRPVEDPLESIMYMTSPSYLPTCTFLAACCLRLLTRCCRLLPTGT